MPDPSHRCAVVSDFNVQNLCAALARERGGLPLEAVPAPYGQVIPALLDRDAPCWRDADFALVWTRPQGAVPAFAELLAGAEIDHERVLEEVESFAAALNGLAGRVKAVFVPSWTLPPEERGLGPLDLRPGLGIAHLLARMNLRLGELLASTPGFYLLDAQRWLAGASRPVFQPKLWYLSKTPFDNEVFRAASGDVRAAAASILGHARKLLIVDLDETLWGGVVGDVGWEGLVLGGHDPVGEALQDFQRALKSLAARGVLLGIVSKNDESVALEAIAKHPEMVLREKDFAGWRINWDDKAQNVADLVSELGLGLSATVFLDDNPAERARVAEALPEVLVPDWPTDRLYSRRALLSLSCFDPAAFSTEDRARVKHYEVDRERRRVRGKVNSLEEWLRTIDMRIRIEHLTEKDSARACQLLNKTNQMNLSTRRMSEQEYTAWSAEEHRRVYVVRVSDRFGDLGLVGLLSLEAGEGGARIVDFVLSCRAMGRRVEESMLSKAIAAAREMGASELSAVYRPTPRNGPCLRFLEEGGWERREDSRFAWDPFRARAYPDPIRVDDAALA